MVLSNPRHERFAQELAKGKTADEAYVLAGYKQNDGNATRLKGNERIVARLEELQNRAASRAEVTVESLIAEAEEVRRLAVEKGQLSAAIAAIKEKGVLTGKRVERTQQQTLPPKTIHDLSNEELMAIVMAGSSDFTGAN